MLRELLRSLFKPAATRLIARGLALRQRGELPEAERVLREAAALFPRDAVAAVNLALVLLEQHQVTAGAAELERALQLDPANGAAHYNLANLLRASGRHDDAIDHYTRAAEAQLPVVQARQELMFALLEVCDWTRAQSQAERLRAHCRQQSPGWERAIAPLTATYLELDADACKQVAAWHATEAARGATPIRRAALSNGDTRLRIGYCSPDFRDHPVGQLISAALPLHDRAHFEVCVYSYGADDGSTYRRDVAQGADRFVDVAGLSDVDAAAAIAADGVHILIDLAGHTTGGRLGIFARRPAPLQAHYLGYAATTGAAYIDYFISDAIATPPELGSAFTEQLACVPGCFMLSGGAPPPVAVAPSRAAAGLPDNVTVFAAFTNASRITRDVFGLWLEILRAVPDSVLWLKQANALTTQNLLTAARDAGIAPERLHFAQRLADKAGHIARLALANLALDTIGWHNGHSTTNDLLWAGLPVLTAPGRTFASRVGASLVTAAGLPELVARDTRDYVNIAINLGNDRAQCAALKQRLSVNRAHALFFDGHRVVAGLEAVYQEMWRIHRSSSLPQAIRIA